MPTLTLEDYGKLGQLLTTSSTAVKERFDKGDIGRYKIQELKTIIKFFREKFQRQWSSNGQMYLSLSGRKADLVSVVKKALAHISDPSTAPTPTRNGNANGVGNSSMNFHQNYQNGYHHGYLPFVQPIDVESITHEKSFLENRTPFHVLKQILAKGPLSTAKQTDLRFALDAQILHVLHQQSTGVKMGVFLRLFCARGMNHVGFNQVQVSVRVNGEYIPIDTRATNNGIKKKGLEIVRPLDITEYCVHDRPIIELYCQSQFHGVVAAELIHIRSIEDVVNEVTAAQDDCDLTENKAQIKQCGYCGTKENLLRCSRCKTTWYCGEIHQEKHWSLHANDCKPITSSAQPAPPSFKQRVRKRHSPSVTDDDECAVVDARCSLRCPLSVGRIKVAAKGANCPHPQCFDLATFVGFCHQTGIWQCPICEKALPFRELEVDDIMNKILSEVPEEIYQVRVLPDGSYKVVSLEEEKLEESRTSRAAKRRKVNSSSSQSLDDDVSDNQSPSSSSSSSSSASNHVDFLRTVLSDDSKHPDGGDNSNTPSEQQTSPSASANWNDMGESSELPLNGDSSNESPVEFTDLNMALFRGNGLGGTLQSAIILD